MRVPLARASLFDAASENDFTLLGENGEYFVSFANRTGTYREFIQAIFEDDGFYPDLLVGDVRANFVELMEDVAMRWGDEFIGDIVYGRGV